MTQEIIDLENVRVIRCMDYDEALRQGVDAQENLYGNAFLRARFGYSLHWRKDHNGQYRWLSCDKNGGNPHDIDSKDQESIRTTLEMTAKKLGVNLAKEKFIDLRKVNIERLVRRVASRIETIRTESEAVHVYKRRDGRMIHLREESSKGF